MFWILAVLLAFAAMGFVCLPLLRKTESAPSESESEQALYQARISEIQKDLELGRLDEASANAAKTEEARRLIKSSESVSARNSLSSNKIIILLAAISLPLISIPFYLTTGSPDFSSGLNQPEQASTQQPSMQDLLEVAENRLKSNPDDTKGWKAVGPVYVRLGRFKDAENAYQNILRVEGRAPEFLLKLADVYIERDKGQINQSARNLIEEVLSVEKDYPIAKFYSGIIALQNDRKDETMRIWQSMVDNSKGDEDWLPVVKGRIAELKSLESEPQLPALDDDTIKAAEEMDPSARNEMINQMVANLAEKLEENPDDKQGWERLVRSYIILGRNEDARDAVEKATRQFPEDNNLKVSLENMIKNENDNNSGESQ